MNDMEIKNIDVSLVIYGFGDLDGLSAKLGLAPSKAVKKGAPLSPGGGPLPQSFWEFSLEGSEDATAEEKVEELIDVLDERKAEVADISSQYRSMLSVGVRSDTLNPEFEFSPITLGRISSLGLTLWLDIYASEDE